VDNARLNCNCTVVANVVSGMDLVDSIREGDEIAVIKLVAPTVARIEAAGR
jgi:molybdopterin converting factor small subunit